MRPTGYLSEIEASILRSNDVPIEINETAEIDIMGQRGIWANKSEEKNWKGIVPLAEYSINEGLSLFKTIIELYTHHFGKKLCLIRMKFD